MKKKARQYVKLTTNAKRRGKEKDFSYFQDIEQDTSSRAYACALIRCNGCGKLVEGVYCGDGMCEECHTNKKRYRENSNVTTFKKAKVVTSKFLELKDKLDNRIRENRGYDNSSMRAMGTSETSLNISELQKAFGELCELLHELTIGK